jgi:hypothetical protein
MKSLLLILVVPLVACTSMPTFTPIPIKRYKTDVVDQTPCYKTNDCPMQNPPAFLFLNDSWRR